MEKRETLDKIRSYNKTLSVLMCSPLEKAFINEINERDYFYGFSITDTLPSQVEKFLKTNHNFKGLLPHHYHNLCFYLKHIQEYTCNSHIIRMDARSQNFSYYQDKVIKAIGSFYLFYGADLHMKDLVYGNYRQLFYNEDFSPVIATELLQDNQEVIQYCQDVLTSENNTAVLTRDVIKAIEQSHNQELQNLLTQVFLAAKLQEGLRQSVIETVDEHHIDYFIDIIDVIKENNLLRYSSIQRGILTWIGLGYETVEERNIRYIFEHIYDYIHHEKQRQLGLQDKNPLNVYIALYCLGIHDVDKAIQEVVELLKSQQRHIVASALIYLKLTNHFSIKDYQYFLETYQEDEWIMALYLSECSRYNFTDLSLNKADNRYFFEHMFDFISKMKTQQTYTSKGFEWFSIAVYKPTLVQKLFEMIQNNPQQDMIEQFLPFVPSNLYYDGLKLFMKKYFSKASLEVRKAFMLKEIISNNKELSDYIAEAYTSLNLTSQDIQQLETRLKTKKDYARANIIKVISQQKKSEVIDSYQRLSTSSIKTIKQSALELQQKVPHYFDQQDQIPKVEILGRKDGYGLYKPNTIYQVPYQSRLQSIERGILKKKTVVDMSFLEIWDKSQILQYISLWNKRIQEHEKDEFKVRGTYHQIAEYGFGPIDYSQNSLDALPLADVWRQYFKEDHLSSDVVFQLLFINQALDINFHQILDSNIEITSLSQKEVKQFVYFSHYRNILSYYSYELENTHFRDQAFQFLEIMNHMTKVKTYKHKNYMGVFESYSLSSLSFFQSMVNHLKLAEASDEEFCEYFPVLYESYVMYNMTIKKNAENKLTIPPLILSRAVVLDILPKDALIEGIMDRHVYINKEYYSQRQHMLFEAYRDAYFKGRGVYGKPILKLPDHQQQSYQCLRETLDLIADQLLSMEVHRLNEETEVTQDVQCLEVIRGIKYLIMALHVLDEENITRNKYGRDRGAVFGRVIRHCYPLATDTPQMLEKECFSEKRLVELAMMAPQWIDMVNEVLKWDGFKEACYYFIAHMKQYDYDQKKAEIVKYTDIDPQDLNDGAFDMEWCQSIYQTLGEKRMKMIYQSAKFLCDNSFHTRARKYADACLEKQSKETYLKQAQEKRNKDALNAYCICPLEDDKDLLTRYLYVQQFLKESKKFGSQRQTSEKRCCEIALINLARNSRFRTVTRLSWMMESQMVSQYIHYLKPQIIEDIEVHIEIDEQGKNEIKVKKNNKKLKSIPARLKKNEDIIKIKEVHHIWNEQYRRSRQMLEQAMEERIVFSKEEIDTIAENPIVSPMIHKLVLMSHQHFGFYHEGQLKGIHDTVDFDDEIKIAHPYDLYQYQCWHEYQKEIFELKIVQPFKQVFRELYTKLDDELEKSETRRYTGYQIQPKKAAGALKSKRWNISYENGLERVYHKENLIVNLYAEADWFSPSDIEAPSIDYVSFYSRKDNQPVKIQDIDDVVFSETMRDVDLAVSTAYVGGVDPVTSFSTMELRKTIIEYTCQLMKLDNVVIQDHFANIQGQHNDYSVHLGSGVIHQKGGAMIHIIPIYSGKRGKVYLPFLDEDPMTAQILTKVIMLAEDIKINDPAILQQITTRKEN